MEKINQFAFFDLGKTFQLLASLQGDPTPYNLVGAIWGVEAKVNALLEGRPFPISVSRAVAKELLEQITIVEKRCVLKKNADGIEEFKMPDGSEAALPSWIIQRLMGSLSKFETVLQEELREATTYFIPRKGIFSTAALIDAADESFPPDVKAFVTEKAKTEWKAAGRCLGLNLHTASGFHVCRAVEAELEEYYQVHCNAAGKTLRSWHEYITKLDERLKADPSSGPTEKTIAELRQMKDDYRNPVAHPRVILAEPDARMLFSNGESLIIAMAQELKTAAENGTVSQPLLMPIQTPGSLSQ